MSRTTRKLFNLVANFVEWEGLNPATYINIKLSNRKYTFARIDEKGITLIGTCLLKDKNIRKISSIIRNKPFIMEDNGDITFFASKKYIPTRDY